MKYYLFILGCAMNYSDAERLVAVLGSLGYSRAKSEAEAGLIITIACSVRQTAIDRIYGKSKLWQKLKKKNPNLKLGLSGCVLERDRKKMQETFDFIFDIKDLTLLPEILGEKKTEIKPEDYFSIHPNYQSDFQAFVPISTGCNNFCTYCAVPYTRGREKSRSLADIVTEVKELVENGYKEITLLGQNVNSYGQDIEKGKNLFVELIKNIDDIPGEYRVYFYSNHPKDMSDELIEVMPKLKHFPAYIHLPLQSGDDEIIRKMNRHYTKEKYLELVRKIRKAMPGVALTTDIIVGFPTETEEQFAKTKDVMGAAKFDMAFLAQYSPRPGTIAAKMVDDVAKAEKKKREDVLQKVLEKTALENNQKLVGQTVRVLIDEAKKGKFYGRTDGYKVVELKTDRKGIIGRFCEVKVESATAWKLFGVL